VGKISTESGASLGRVDSVADGTHSKKKAGGYPRYGLGIFLSKCCRGCVHFTKNRHAGQEAGMRIAPEFGPITVSAAGGPLQEALARGGGLSR